jgi:hypothetical protein
VNPNLSAIPSWELQAELLAQAITDGTDTIIAAERSLEEARRTQAGRMADLARLLRLRESVRGTGELHTLDEGGSTPPPATNSSYPPIEPATCRWCHQPVPDMAAHECTTMKERLTEFEKSDTKGRLL